MPRKTPKGKRAAKLVLAGTHSHVEAGLELGITAQAVSAALRAQGVWTSHTERGRAAITKAARQWNAEFGAIRKREVAAKYRAALGYPDPIDILKAHQSGLTYSQIATRLGMTRNQVAGYVFRARKAVAS